MPIAIHNVSRHAHYGVSWAGHRKGTTEPAPTREFSPTVMLAQNVGVVAEEDAVAVGWMALAMALAGSAKRHALVQGHVVLPTIAVSPMTTPVA